MTKSPSSQQDIGPHSRVEDTRNTSPAWSHSRLVVGESCPFRALLQYKRKIPEPERPPLPEGQEYPNDRGSRVHKDAKRCVKGEHSITPELARHFKAEFEKLRRLHQAGQVVVEDTWSFDENWQPLELLGAFPEGPWPQAFADRFHRIWVRIALDACVFLDDQTVVAIDYKTGKKWGNEIKHAEQLQLYMVAVFLRYPKVEKVITEAWYLDKDEITQIVYTQKQLPRYLKTFNTRGLKFTSMTEFLPTPSYKACSYCPYKTGQLGKSGVGGTGHCDANPDA